MRRLAAALRRAAAGTALAAVLIVCLPQAASAHNCGSLSDCFRTAAVALAVIAAIAIVVAGIVAFPYLVASLGAGVSAGVGGTAVVGGAIAVPASVAVAADVAIVSATGATAAAGLSMMASRRSGKERGSDIPSWARGERPQPGETPVQAADRILTGRYGQGNYPKGPGSEFNKIKKFFERLLRR